MWVITVFSKENITMFEFQTENEAREALRTFKVVRFFQKLFILMIMMLLKPQLKIFPRRTEYFLTRR